MKKNAGLTMVELIVATLIAVILTVSVAAIASPIYRTYQRTLDHADGQLIAGNVLDTLRSGARTASTVKATSAADGSAALDIGKGVYSVQGGKLYFDATPIYADGYYNGKSVRLTCVQQGNNAVNVTVSVTGHSGELAEVSAVIMPMRSILDNDKATPQGMSDLAGDLANSFNDPTVSRPDYALFDDLFINHYGSQWPAYDVGQIFTVEKLTALRDQYAAASAEYLFYDGLLRGAEATKPFWLATYFTVSAHLPVVYLTDTTSQTFVSSGLRSGNVYAIFYNGLWYINAAKTSGFYMSNPDLNACLTAAEFENWLYDTSMWLNTTQVAPTGP